MRPESGPCRFCREILMQESDHSYHSSYPRLGHVDEDIRKLEKRFATASRISGKVLLPMDEYPHTDIGLPIRGKHFFAREENPKYEDLGSNPPEGDFIERLARIKEWEEAHKPKLETLKLDDLTAEDYKKVYAKNANIKIEQIELAPMTEDLWLTYRRIEGAVNVILVEAHLAGRQATEYRHLSQYPSGHDFYLQLRNRVSKKTGISYQAVSRGLNHILKKDMINGMRTDTVYRDAYVALGQDWNRTNLWKMDGDHVIEAREKHGKDWIKRDTLVWSWDPLMKGDRVTDEGEYADHSWPHWRRYTKEHSTLL
jgi:hypothetical protein